MQDGSVGCDATRRAGNLEHAEKGRSRRGDISLGKGRLPIVTFRPSANALSRPSKPVQMPRDAHEEGRLSTCVGGVVSATRAARQMPAGSGPRRGGRWRDGRAGLSCNRGSRAGVSELQLTRPYYETTRAENLVFEERAAAWQGEYALAAHMGMKIFAVVLRERHCGGSGVADVLGEGPACRGGGLSRPIHREMSEDRAGRAGKAMADRIGNEITCPPGGFSPAAAIGPRCTASKRSTVKNWRFQASEWRRGGQFALAWSDSTVGSRCRVP